MYIRIIIKISFILSFLSFMSACNNSTSAFEKDKNNNYQSVSLFKLNKKEDSSRIINVDNTESEIFFKNQQKRIVEQNTSKNTSNSARFELPVNLNKLNNNFNKLSLSYDYDQDGLNDTVENALGTSPKNSDSDSDGLSDGYEYQNELDPLSNDTDQDGWVDGNKNIYYKLKLLSITSKNILEEDGYDEIYVMVDSRRFPENREIDNFFEVKKNKIINYKNRIVARRTIPGTLDIKTNNIKIEIWENNLDFYGNWKEDVKILSKEIDISLYNNNNIITLKKSFNNGVYSYIYEIKFMVEKLYFADPNPKNATSDDDSDGFSEIEEFELGMEVGGDINIFRPDIFVEIDYLEGFQLSETSKRQLISQYYRNGYDLHLIESDILAFDNCFSFPELLEIYNKYFDYNYYSAMHYAILVKDSFLSNIGNAGISMLDTIIVHAEDSDDYTFLNTILFIHEMGHQIGLNSDIFSGIDAEWPSSYDSAMNYNGVYNDFIMDYSNYDSDGTGDGDFNDWEHIDLTFWQSYDYNLPDIFTKLYSELTEEEKAELSVMYNDTPICDLY